MQRASCEALRAVALSLALVGPLACETPPTLPDAPAGGLDSALPRCQSEPFVGSIAVPEASGAAVVALGTSQALVVVSDSGNQGAYAAVDVNSGALLHTGKLPLGPTSDDVEGLSVLDGDLWGVTSAGWLYRWRALSTGDGFRLVQAPTAMGAVDEAIPADGGLGDTPPRPEWGLVCNAQGVNCGRNYEGLCLDPAAQAVTSHSVGGAGRRASADCVGLVVAKAEAALYCVVRDGAGLAIDGARKFALSFPGALADCAIDANGRAWVGSNSYRFGEVYVVSGWQQLPATPSVTTLDDVSTTGFAEVLAHGPARIVYRMADNGRPGPSEVAAFRCEW